ncbi:MAG TPA: hypothetical protein VFA76_12330 [Terriglobales bacterium]|nr:hypothetical protein [Terriglobales bacterium]
MGTGLRKSALLAAVAAMVCLSAVTTRAQTPSDPQSDDTKSWHATREQQNVSGDLYPTRTTESHTLINGRTIDKETVEGRDSEGHYHPYYDTEKESTKVDASTTRTVERVFARGPTGERKLIRVIEEESRSLPGGDEKVFRTTSNLDLQDRLQVVTRENRETKQVSRDVRETNTTVSSPDVNGGFSPTVKTQERETRKNDNTIEFRKSTLLQAGDGNWQVHEIREGTIIEDKSEGGKHTTKEERVSRPDGNGNLAVVERTVTKSDAAAGEKKQKVEKYSSNIPGTAADGSLRLEQRVSTVTQLGANGEQKTEEQVEQRNLGNPSFGLQPAQKTIDIVRTNLSGGTEETLTIQIPGPGAGPTTVWVDTKKSDKKSAVQVDTKPVDAKPSAKPH